MFNKNVIEVLKSVSPITDTMVLKYPNTYTRSSDRIFLVKLPISQLDSDQFNDIGFNHSLNDFLNLLNLFGDESNIAQEGDIIYIKSNDIDASFITDDISLIEQFNVDETQIDRTKQCETVASFTLTTSDINALKKASSVLKNSNDLVFDSKDGKIILHVTNINFINNKSNTYSLTKTAVTNKEFKVTMLMADFARLPVADYDVEIKINPNAKNNNYRLLLKSKALENFEIVVCINNVKNPETVE